VRTADLAHTIRSVWRRSCKRDCRRSRRTAPIDLTTGGRSCALGAISDFAQRRCDCNRLRDFGRRGHGRRFDPYLRHTARSLTGCSASHIGRQNGGKPSLYTPAGRRLACGMVQGSLRFQGALGRLRSTTIAVSLGGPHGRGFSAGHSNRSNFTISKTLQGNHALNGAVSPWLAVSTLGWAPSRNRWAYEISGRYE
jgi:hypothetical protein